MMCQRDHQDVERLEQEAANAIDAVIKTTQHFKKIYENINPSLIYDIEKYHPLAWTVHQKYREMKVLTAFKRNIERGIGEGLYRENIDPELLAILHLHQIEWACNVDIFPPEKFDLLNVHLALTEHFIRGIVTRQGFEKLEDYINQANHYNHENE
ncbi:MAG: hypothetical protein HC880_08055 [Bacteroidia bacterium]|nr:hypothetical protein [Bacteroidia bacterium]